MRVVHWAAGAFALAVRRRRVCICRSAAGAFALAVAPQARLHLP